MELAGEILLEALCLVVVGFFFLTGELLLLALTLGRRRVRWWNVHDGNESWMPALLGFAFWTGVVGLIVFAVSR